MGFTALWIEALDTLFFRDGRPFSAATRAESGLPTPQTLTGAIRTWLMRQLDCDFEALGLALRDKVSLAEALKEQSLELTQIATIQIRGPWLARKTNDQYEPLVPVPAALRKIKAGNQIRRLYPYSHELSGWKPALPGLLPLWLKERAEVERLEGFLNLAGLETFLAGGIPEKTIPATDLYMSETRTGIGLDNYSLSAAEGMIYAIQLLRLCQDVGFYAEVEWPESLSGLLPEQGIPIPFGGENRQALFKPIDPAKWPQPLQPSSRQLRTQLLLTPALAEHPDWLKQLPLRAAALHPWQAVSGWDLALGGPKPLRWALPAGSVLYYDPQTKIPNPLCPGESGQLGWGITLEGVSDNVH
jgi:CRISPR-associated protein Cmr3